MALPGTPISAAPEGGSRFSERDFYLAEFRGRTLGLAIGALGAEDVRRVSSVLDDLAAHSIAGIAIATDPGVAEELSGAPAIVADSPGWIGALWRERQARLRSTVLVDAAGGLARAACRMAHRLRLAKLVFVDARGGLLDGAGERVASVDLAGLERWLAAGAGADTALLQEIRDLLGAGFPSVTVCSAEGLDDEIFTWAGSGTFFLRERYADVRHLAMDEFAAAAELVRRGVEEGYLLDRGPEQVEAVLENAYGVFVEGRFLAGIAALIPYPDERVAEIASLYTLTRFLGEGVGGHLLRYARERAAADGMRAVFACTTSDRVARFFERNGFQAVEQSEIPETKWRAYDTDRRDRVRCFSISV